MSGNLKRQRPEALEQESQEAPAKKTELDGDSQKLFRPAAPIVSKIRPATGLFRQSKLPTIDLSKSESLQKLKEQQDQDKEKKPFVFLDPSKQCLPRDVENVAAPLIPTHQPNRNEKTKTETSIFGKFSAIKTECKQAPESLKDETVKNLNQFESAKPTLFQRVAQESSSFNGFQIKEEKNDPAIRSNPFKKLAIQTDNGTSAWSRFKKEDADVPKIEPEEDSAIETEKMMTGEEKEKNVLQLSCKLFQFDKENSTYSERGRGTLRMNDCGEGTDFKSRLVFRTTGTQKVALNSKLWANMSVEQVSAKSIRISAQDPSSEGGVGIFLVQTAVQDSKELFKAIDSRIVQMKQAETPHSNT